MSRLDDVIFEGAALVVPVLNGELGIEVYVNKIREMIALVLEADQAVIDGLSVSESAKQTLIGDQAVMSSLFTEEKDRVSMLSTLIAYVQSKEEGLPDHSKVYMDRVRDLRLMISEHYEASVQKFCGS